MVNKKVEVFGRYYLLKVNDVAPGDGDEFVLRGQLQLQI
jgi:hypothetical protein